MKLLFLCTHNACRSILAQSIAQQCGGDIWTVESAGSNPAGQIHPDTVAELQARNLPVASLHSKSLEDVSSFAPDFIITVCDQAAGESCPTGFAQAIKIHWGLADPTKQQDPILKKQTFEQLITTLENRLGRLANTLRKEQPDTEQLTVLLEHLKEIK
jgi:arsenate reductase